MIYHRYYGHNILLNFKDIILKIIILIKTITLQCYWITTEEDPAANLQDISTYLISSLLIELRRENKV